MKYKTRPIYIEAVHFTKEVALKYFQDRLPILGKLHPSGTYNLVRNEVYTAYIQIFAATILKANLGDWVIKYSDGSFGVLSDSKFMITYEEV